jgi:hypothetical protein
MDASARQQCEAAFGHLDEASILLTSVDCFTQ